MAEVSEVWKVVKKSPASIALVLLLLHQSKKCVCINHLGTLSPDLQGGLGSCLSPISTTQTLEIKVELHAGCSH